MYSQLGHSEIWTSDPSPLEVTAYLPWQLLLQ